MQVWRSPHPPVRGNLWLGSRPMIHSGFLASWNGEGLDQQVLLRVRQILEGQQHGSSSSSGDDGGGGMAAFDTTVARCCSKVHEEKEAELAEAAAAARAAEAAEAGSNGQVDIDEAELEAAASQLLSLTYPFKGSSSLGVAGSPGGRSSSLRSMGSTASSTGRPFRIFVTGHRCAAEAGLQCALNEACRFDCLCKSRPSANPPTLPTRPSTQPGRRSGHAVRFRHRLCAGELGIYHSDQSIQHRRRSSSSSASRQ